MRKRRGCLFHPTGCGCLCIVAAILLIVAILAAPPTFGESLPLDVPAVGLSEFEITVGDTLVSFFSTLGGGVAKEELQVMPHEPFSVALLALPQTNEAPRVMEFELYPVGNDWELPKSVSEGGVVISSTLSTDTLGLLHYRWVMDVPMKGVQPYFNVPAGSVPVDTTQEYTLRIWEPIPDGMGIAGELQTYVRCVAPTPTPTPTNTPTPSPSPTNVMYRLHLPMMLR